jgi:formylglycine-generating enzyme required for sulfatase activity
MKKRLLTWAALLWLSPLTMMAPPGRFWMEDAQQVAGWYGTDWYGWVAWPGPDLDWVYHVEHGWTYSTSINPATVYWWSLNTGWCWFSNSQYPWMYRLANNRWLYYLKGSGSLYFDSVLGRWIDQPALQLENEMVLVEGGTFNVVYRPSQVDSFYISEFETTWGEWLEVRDWAALNGYDIGTRGHGCEDNHPVRYISWYDAVKWCNARSEKENLTPVYYTDTAHATVYRTGDYKVSNSEAMWTANGYRLPTEAEWQFAARGGNASQGYLYSGSNTLDEAGWYSMNTEGAACDLTSLQTGKGTWPVGQKLPNELGLFDMSGNVTEWCWDWYGNIFSFELEINPHGPETGNLVDRIQRGGGWVHGDWDCEVTSRGKGPPKGYGEFVGFRVVRRTLEQ